ncbi:MAG TPA: bifunctional rhamnulose-1-phosphate aldolase/short-chain dehydrogenase [Steroidobacteraceae bacterium]|jgi:rhamnulose-1-phosphate aldolase/alcohol dehydrogenase|nr:bifunctional rhamnulose-1-phosphate aldolase/short-chain dehydrogenase [Steroidobacteraceae bacterium]
MMISIQNQWDPAYAATLSPEQLLLYRSNLLGADLRITNYGGGNTSAKLVGKDPVSGQQIPVLWVKGSGGDLGTMGLDGFATLYQDKLLALQTHYRGPEDEDRMVGLYPHCAFNLNPRAPSIDTPLHALIDRPHVDHMHPDAVIAIAASSDSRQLTEQIWGQQIGWLPWIRPGFELGMQLNRFLQAHPQARGVLLEAHGLFTWGNCAHSCYENTLDIINRAIAWLEARSDATLAFGPSRVTALPPDRRRDLAAALMPRIRGLICGDTPKIGHFDDSAEVLQFVNSRKLEALAAMGTSCPDHFLRTKIRPLVLAYDATQENERDLLERLPQAIATYRQQYQDYYERCKRGFSPKMRDPNAVVYLVPAVGMITFAADKATARIASEFYVNAINVMRGAAAVSTYRGLPEQEAFDIEYWPLEEAKLQRLPPRQALAGRIALVTGGAGGIGMASARRLAAEGACVVLCDIDPAALAQAQSELRAQFGADSAIGVHADVTNERTINDLFRETAWRYGGLDICVSNAGIASASPIEDTTLELWNRNLSILTTGYFLVSRASVRLLKAQGLGGSIVFIGSKNALAASAGAAAYCTAKAAELHLARCLALECAGDNIRVNVVNPDAVLRGSRIWQGEWAEQRARQNNTTPEALEKLYRERSLLKASVYPEDVAEAVAFFASNRSAKSTGNIINVDAGNATAFTR